MSDKRPPLAPSTYRSVPFKDRVKDYPVSSNAAVHHSDELDRQQFLKGAAAIDEKSRFYNKPEAVADVALWATRLWTCDESVALSLGKNPKIVNRKTLSPYVEAWDFAREYFKRGTFLGDNIFPPTGAVPAKWVIASLERIGIAMPKTLIDAVRHEELAEPLQEPVAETGAAQMESESSLQSKLSTTEARILELEQLLVAEKLKPKSRTTYDKLVLALALKYEFDPAKNSSVAANIVGLLDRGGVKIDRGVVRKSLEEAMSRKAAGDFDP